MTWPFENDTSSTVKKLAKRSLKAGKNTIAILSIALAAVMFTSVFTIAMSMKDTWEENAMRGIGTYAHAGLKHVTLDEYEELASDSRWADHGYCISVGFAVGNAFLKTPGEVRWADDFYAESSFCYPDTGHMPKAEKEIAMSRLLLTAMGLSHELGTEVELTIQTHTQTITDTFMLCGTWEGDTVAGAQEIWLSRAYTDKVAPVVRGSSQGVDDSDDTGYVAGSFMLPNAWNLEARAGVIAADHGMEDDIHTNFAYTSFRTQPSEILTVLVAALVVLTAGYLLIYNVFYISVAQDVRFYGQLKTLGATPKQLRKLVYSKALRLSAVGIPLGLILGWPIGSVLAPLVAAGQSAGNTRAVISANPIIFAAAVVFALLTVFISCLRPARFAGKVSPIEAIRYVDAPVSRKKERNAKPVTAIRMAWQNLGRGKKKVIVVTLSLTLSLVILNTAFAFFQTFDFDKYVSSQLMTDFTVSDAPIISGNTNVDPRLSSIDQPLQAQIESLDGLEASGSVYLQFLSQFYTDDMIQRMHAIGQNPVVAASQGYQWEISSMEGTGEYIRDWYDVGLYGLDEFPASKLEVLEGELDMEKWRSGEGVFVSPTVTWGDASWYHPGDKLTVVYENAVDYDAGTMDFQGDGAEKTYEVLAVVRYPHAYSCGHLLASGTCFFFSSEEYLAHVEKAGQLPMMIIFDVDDDHLAAAEQWIQDYTENVDPTLGYRSRGTLAGSYQGLIDMFTIVGGALCALLALIGVLNFINSMVTSVLTRRGEIAMLQAVGMTGSQVQKMLVFEGLGYAVLGIVSSLILAALVNVTALQSITADMDYFTYRFTLVPALLCAIPLLAVTALVPWLCYRKMAKVSIVERLRLTE
ncbi:MAG: ABC transporter permease [Lachnospiraceae bacterium]|nr:ABC transporter permease [Lachnospiraceae bacterium]